MRHLDPSAIRCGRSNACICRRCRTGTDRFSLEWSPVGLGGHRYRQTLSWQDILNGSDNAVILRSAMSAGARYRKMITIAAVSASKPAASRR